MINTVYKPWQLYVEPQLEEKTIHLELKFILIEKEGNRYNSDAQRGFRKNLKQCKH